MSIESEFAIKLSDWWSGYGFIPLTILITIFIIWVVLIFKRTMQNTFFTKPKIEPEIKPERKVIMTVERVAKAIEEAKRFIEKAQAAQAWMRLNDTSGIGIGGAATGACCRASMDLSRALIELRKGTRE